MSLLQRSTCLHRVLSTVNNGTIRVLFHLWGVVWELTGCDSDLCDDARGRLKLQYSVLDDWIEGLPRATWQFPWDHHNLGCARVYLFELCSLRGLAGTLLGRNNCHNGCVNLFAVSTWAEVLESTETNTGISQLAREEEQSRLRLFRHFKSWKRWRRWY